MSSTIEFERRAYRIEDENSGSNFLTLAKMGESNVFVVRPNGNVVIAKDWKFFEFGKEHEIMSKVIKLGECTKSGDLRYGDGYTKPENYIMNWRKTLRDARTFDDFKAEFYKREVAIQFLKDNNFGIRERLEEERLRELNSNWKRD